MANLRIPARQQGVRVGALSNREKHRSPKPLWVRAFAIAAWLVGLGVAGCDTTACGEDYILCGEACIAGQTDPENCGGCGNVCGAGETCFQGACVSGSEGCPSGRASCEDGCRDLSEDPANCGECGNACVEGEVCSKGECASQCAEGTAYCGGDCIDVSGDPAHCGECGNACAEGEVCSAGECKPPCAEGEEQCGEVCADTAGDVEHCGGCGEACSTVNAVPQCIEGACQLTCEPGFGDCDDDVTTGCETSVVSNSLHCGACGQVCGGNTVCAGTGCVANLVNTIAYGDYVYATLDDIPPSAAYGSYGTCQRDPLPLHVGWELVPEDIGVVQNVIAPNAFSTHCILFENGVSYGGQAYSPGDNCGCSGDQCLKTDGNGNYWTSSCSRRILIRRPK